MTPNEFRKNAEDSLKLAHETDEIYAKTALIELATEFRVMAEHTLRESVPRARRRGDRVKRREFITLLGGAAAAAGGLMSYGAGSA